jgi:hypothetical protein
MGSELSSGQEARIRRHQTVRLPVLALAVAWSRLPARSRSAPLRQGCWLLRSAAREAS